ncbi:MAG: hypothetical protein RLZZ225_384 [Pseudomonadota bacterium]|jgi:hypothetical protein
MKKLATTFKLKKNFVSSIDEFLAAFDQRHWQKSTSQQQEITQYQALKAKRDSKTNPPS